MTDRGKGVMTVFKMGVRENSGLHLEADWTMEEADHIRIMYMLMPHDGEDKDGHDARMRGAGSAVVAAVQEALMGLVQDYEKARTDAQEHMDRFMGATVASPEAPAPLEVARG